jgi:hypothetical protein
MATNDHVSTPGHASCHPERKRRISRSARATRVLDSLINRPYARSLAPLGMTAPLFTEQLRTR